MNNIKSGLVIAILLGILYGVYTTLSKPDPVLPAGMTRADVENLGPPDIEVGTDEAISSPGGFAKGETEIPELPDQMAPFPDDPSDKSPAESENDRTATRSDSIYGVAPSAIPDKGSGAGPSSPDESGSEASPSEANTVEPAPEGNKVGSYGNPYRGSPNQKISPTDPTNGEVNKASAIVPINQDLTKIALHDYQIAMSSAKLAIDNNRLVNALEILSPMHSNPSLPEEQRAELHTWLDALAARVIYSPEHHLEQPHVVQGNSQTLYDVANHYNVPAQLLQNINAGKVNDARILIPGTELKIVPGPFRAEIDLKRSEITLYLNKLYAGRFPCTFGAQALIPGEYMVHNKQRDRDYFGVDRTIAGNDPNNPYGGYWMDLGNDICIHGSPVGSTNDTSALGSIGLSSRDASDVFGILSKESAVLIR